MVLRYVGVRLYSSGIIWSQSRSHSSGHVPVLWYPIYILPPAPDWTNGCDIYSVISLSLILNFSREIVNYIDILPQQTAYSSLPKGGVGQLFLAQGRA